jgi:hypothetical protein
MAEGGRLIRTHSPMTRRSAIGLFPPMYVDFPLTKYKKRFTASSQAHGAPTTFGNYATCGGGPYEDQVMHGRRGPVPPTLNHDGRGFVSHGVSSRSC